ALTQAAVDRALDPAGDGRYDVEYRVQHRTGGQMRWVHATGQTFFEGGQAVRLVGTVQDVSEAKEVQAQLRLARDQFQNMAESMPQLVWTANSAADVDYYNSRAVSYKGIQPRLDGRYTWQAVLHPDDAEHTLAAWQAAVARLEPYECEHRLEMADGSFRWHISRAVPVAIGPGERVKWYGTATDVHALKETEAALRESEARFRTMANHAPVMIWVSQPEGRCTYLSQSWYAFTGQPDGTGLEYGWLEAVHPDQQERAEQTFLAANKFREPFRMEYLLRRQDGHYRWVLDSAQPRYNDTGDFLGYIGSILDITDRRQAEEALRASEYKYRSLFNTIDEGLCICEMVLDAQGQPVDYRFLEVNPMFIRHTGLERPQGKTARALLPDLEPEWFALYAGVALERQPTRFTQGSEVMGRWFEGYAFPVDSAESLRFAILFTDVTPRRLQEQALRQQHEVLEQLIDFLPVMITIYQPSTQILYLNKAFEHLTGWSTEEAAKIDLMAAVYPDPDYRQAVREYMQSLEPGWRDFTMTARDGTPIASSWANIQLSDGRQVGIGVDIRERKENEERGRLLQNLAAALSSAVTPQEVTEVIIQEGLRVLGGVGGTVALLTEDEARWKSWPRWAIQSGWWRSGSASRWSTPPRQSPWPCANAATSGCAIWKNESRSSQPRRTWRWWNSTRPGPCCPST
ncbi:MAG: PAS domain S-box protein, partial [Anaerolineae bacterium]|nr:PAS domain S-box protein [Anaerolineae bacterium]